MAGPNGITITIPPSGSQPPPTTIGVVVENTPNGTVNGWELKEFIDLDEDRSDLEVFEVAESIVSDWLPAQLGNDEHRVDTHIMSTTAIAFNKMKADGTEYRCVYTQVFKKRQVDGDESEPVNSSGFNIVHTVKYQSGEWQYFSIKTGAGVMSFAAGTGTIRYPPAGWARVPI